MKLWYQFILNAMVIFLSAGFAFAENGFPKITAFSPEVGMTDVASNSSITISFSCAMNKRSVEDGWYIYPVTPGRFHWNESSFIFEPQRPLLPSTTYIISFNSQVKADNGIPLHISYFTTAPQGLCVDANNRIKIIDLKKNDDKNILAEGNNPVWSWDNRNIIYDYQGQLWIMDHDGENKVQLTADERIVAAKPNCHSAASKITFIGTDMAGVSNVYILEKDTKVVRQLTAFFEPSPIDYFRWSPDGLYFAFLRARQIWIANQEGGSLRRLTTNDTACKVNFSWSPGGTKIVFSGDKNIWIVDIYSLQIRKASFDNPKTGAVYWSNDNKIVFEADGITVMDADGSNERRFLSSGKFPGWLNHNRLFSFILPLSKNEPAAQLWIMRDDGQQKKKIADISANNFFVSWSKPTNLSVLFSP